MPRPKTDQTERIADIFLAMTAEERAKVMLTLRAIEMTLNRGSIEPPVLVKRTRKTKGDQASLPGVSE